MRFLKYAIIAVMLLGFTTIASAKEKQANKVYLFGFAASFNDSTVYFTTIQEVQGAYVSGKGNFLVNREEYSYQLRNYLQGLGNAHPTCITSYAYTRKDIEKKYEKLKQKYTEKAKGRYIVEYLDDTKFMYSPVAIDAGSVIVDPKEAEKAALESKKKAKK